MIFFHEVFNYRTFGNYRTPNGDKQTNIVCSYMRLPPTP